MSFTGTWQAIVSLNFDDDYLLMETEPYVKLRQIGNHVDGQYRIGLQGGIIDGRLQGENQMIFSFEGMDEVNGTGMAMVEGDQLTFTLMYYLGDKYTFKCERRWGKVKKVEWSRVGRVEVKPGKPSRGPR